MPAAARWMWNRVSNVWKNRVENFQWFDGLTTGIWE
jgi:hypothetical protein